MRLGRLFILLVPLFSSIVLTEAARAEFANVFGLGPQSIAMGGTSLIYGKSSPFSAYSNPAALGYISQAEISLGILSMDANLQPFGRIVIDEGGKFGVFDSSGVLGGRGQVIGIALPIGKKTHPLTLGVAAYFSGDSISRISGPPVNNPFYPMYQDVSRNTMYTVGAGYRIYEGLSLGLALNTSLLSLADYRLHNDTGVSFSSSTVEVRSIFSASYALTYDFVYGNEGGDKGTPLILGLMRRGQSELKTKLMATMEVQGIPINGELVSFPHFSPAEWILSASYQLNSSWSLGADLSYVEWSKYHNPYGSGNINSFIFGNGSERAGFKDIFVPRVGAQYKFIPRNSFAKEWAFRLGYFYYPTPVPDQLGNSNFADSSRHGISGGVGLGIHNPWADTESLIHFDSYVQFNHVVERNVKKISGTSLGAPGYSIGGNIWIYGISTSIAL